MPARPSRFRDIYIRIDGSFEESFRIDAWSPDPPRFAKPTLPSYLVSNEIIPLSERVRNEAVGRQDIVQLGGVLFEALFRDEVRDLFRYLEGKLADYQRLRVLLEVEPREMQGLPWECVYDPWRREFVSTRARALVVRYVQPVSDLPQAGSPEASLRTVVAIASRSQLGPVDAAR